MKANQFVTAAVEPLRAEAIEKAIAFAKRIVDQYREALEAEGMDRARAFPYPRRSLSYGMDRKEHQIMVARYHLASRLTKADPSKGYQIQTGRGTDPYIVVMDQEGIDKFIADTAEQASMQYDGFIAKLTEKVGEITDAVLEGNHVWGYSFLTVTKPDNSTEVWKTQQIVNQSKLGLVFNQWPTRKVKAK